MENKNEREYNTYRSVVRAGGDINALELFAIESEILEEINEDKVGVCPLAVE